MLAPAGKALVETAGFGLADSKSHLDSGGAEAIETMAGDGGIGVDGRRYDALESSGDQRFRAGPGAAGVVAGLQGYIGSAAAGAFGPMAFRSSAGTAALKSFCASGE